MDNINLETNNTCVSVNEERVDMIKAQWVARPTRSIYVVSSNHNNTSRSLLDKNMFTLIACYYLDSGTDS